MRTAHLLFMLVCVAAGCAISFPPSPRDGENKRATAAAIDSLRLAFADRPHDIELLARLAACQRRLNTPADRARSIETIDRALAIAPDDPSLHLERGITMLARRFTGEAERCFTRVIELDPSRSEAWFKLGLIEKRRFLTTWRPRERLGRAARLIRHAARLAPADAGIIRELAVIELLRERWTDARRASGRLSRLSPEDPTGHLVAAAAFLAYGRFADAEEAFGRAFPLMPPERRAAYEDISSLLEPADRERYLALPDEAKIQRNERHWIMTDPTPSTPLNERRLEHYRRVFLAGALFGGFGKHGADTHRGRSFVRFGPPDGTGTDLGAGLEGPWLVWWYDHPDGAFRLFFQDEFLGGNYHFPISRGREGRHSALLLEKTSPLYRVPGLGDPFHLLWTAAQRRGEDETTLVEFAVSFADSLARDPWERWELRVTIFDPSWKRIAIVSRPFAPDTLPAAGGRLICPVRFRVAPRALECTCALELENRIAGKLAVASIPLRLRDMHGDRLRMSDLRLLSPISGPRDVDVLDPDPRYRDGDSLLVSYEIYGLRRDEEGHCRRRTRYEIVRETPERRSGLGGLIDAVKRGAGRMKPAGPAIVGFFDQTGSGRDVDDRLRIAVAGLEPGRYRLRVTATDLVSGSEAVAERGFLVTE